MRRYKIALYLDRGLNEPLLLLYHPFGLRPPQKQARRSSAHCCRFIFTSQVLRILGLSVCWFGVSKRERP